MAGPTEVESSRLRASAGYSVAVRKLLVLSAIAITLLPIPITYFGILPAYQVHARFLLFYAPFICLLTLCYLFYVRDSLARAMFADVLDPPPHPDPYYPEPLSEAIRRGFRGVKGAILMILPALLVIGSMYCIVRYLAVLDQSVALATQTEAGRPAVEEGVGLRKGEEKRPSTKPSGPSGSSARKRMTQPPGGADTLSRPSSPAGTRQQVLRTTRIDGIPHLILLSGLYIGAFLALLIAVTLMALKEYAKEALGLSEHELVFGRYRSGANQ